MSMSSITAIQLRSARRLRQIPTFHAIHVSHESIRVALTARQSLPAYPISGHSQWPSACLKRARSCHSRAPERSAGEPGNPSLGRAPPLEGRAPQHSAGLCATAARGYLRATAERTAKLHRLGTIDVGRQSVRATSDRRAGPRRVAATHLSRASPSGTRSRSGGAPLPRPAPWRAA